ncbi:hypothetical protein GGR54DRAFT_624474 [Hypoxylon sp. NC1633]|nr:hypothetical protein GGR54DRAFT_624474 [Hypoxylon sp. NC1633]
MYVTYTCCPRNSKKPCQPFQVNIFYAHGPDHMTPLKEQAAAFDAVNREVKCAKTGIWNFSPEEYEKYLDICEEWVTWGRHDRCQHAPGVEPLNLLRYCRTSQPASVRCLCCRDPCRTTLAMSRRGHKSSLGRRCR